MTKIEEEIMDALSKPSDGKTRLDIHISKVAAEVAKKYIKRAYNAGAYTQMGDVISCDTMRQHMANEAEWLKENGIV